MKSNLIKFLGLGLVLFSSSCTVRKFSNSQTNAAGSAVTQKVKVGRFSSRGLWTPASREMPAILMLPGSGAQGPEEMIPGTLTASGNDEAIFSQLAEPFIKAGFNVLALGKPGVEFFSGWDQTKMFYDVNRVKQLTWKDLVDNAKDGVAFLKQRSSVDSDRIYILGHSEGTQIATDVAKEVDIAGLILLGYAGDDLISRVKWQMTDRTYEHFIKTDVDANHDGFITKVEADIWPNNFGWNWQPGQDRVALTTVREVILKDPKIQQTLDSIKNAPQCKTGKCDGGPFYEDTSKFAGPLYVYTGALDLQTKASEALALGDACKKKAKKNCFINIVPGVQHGFSPPKPPRRHPLLDIAVGPVSPEFKKQLSTLAQRIIRE